MEKKKVLVIPSNQESLSNPNSPNFKKKKVAAYARVSTSSEEQELSYDTQIDYYDRYIHANPNWEFVGIYSDKGISGVRVSKRLGFQKMIKDAKEEKIDLILTKSISRFARNTMDTLRIVRELKENNIEVIFEKENLSTLDSKSEMILTIMSSIAQEESRSLSENIKWGKRKRMASGDAYCDYSRMYGYAKNEFGEFIINEAEAKIVKEIYELYILGYTQRKIARILNARKIPTKHNRRMWDISNIQGILSNEKYIGNSLFQKTYSADFITKKRIANKGALPKYYIYNTHPPIVSRGTYELVQAEHKRRRDICHKAKIRNYFVPGQKYGGKIICGKCGCCYTRRKSLRRPSNYLMCINRYSTAPDKRCNNRIIREDVFNKEFIKAFNKLLKNKDEVIKHCLDDLILIEDKIAAIDESNTASLEQTQKTKSQISNLYAEHERVERFIAFFKKSKTIRKFSGITFMLSVKEIILNKSNVIFKWNY